jgi:hypothetical protein
MTRSVQQSCVDDRGRAGMLFVGGPLDGRAAVAWQVLVVPAMFCVANCCCRGRASLRVLLKADTAARLEVSPSSSCRMSFI